jgi:hypothetical protein
VGFFAVFYLMAQAIERLLEPVSNFVGTTKSNGEKLEPAKAKAKRDKAVAEALQAPGHEKAKAAAASQDEVDQIRANMAVVLWAAASFLAKRMARLIPPRCNRGD